tara:strand:- start:153 stop:770 length:618 start_codon:yes stop_codon:yes gene_type:complete
LKKNKFSKNWVIKNNRDPYYKASKAQGYRSRSAFKLIEINDKFKFIENNSNLLDLGSSPGGWSQVASKKIKNGKILAVDIIEMKNIKNVDFIKGDFKDEKIQKKIKLYFDKAVDIIVSDMAVNTTGNKSLDSYRTGQISIEAMLLASKILSNNGVFLTKIFMGSIFKEIKERSSKIFKNIVIYKPLSSKKKSKEIYIFCKGILKV